MKTTRFVSQAAAKAVEQKGASGINATTINAYTGGAASVTVAIKAGSRYEQSQGLAHIMAAARNTTSRTHTRFLQQQQLGYAGATFTCNNTRDHLVYTLTCGPKLISELFNDVCIPAIFQGKYNQWELDELEVSLKHQKNKLSQTDRLLDSLHQVSFSGTLSSSKYVPDHRLGKGSMIHGSSKASDYYMFYMPVPEIGERQRVQTAECEAHREELFKTGNVQVMMTGLSEVESGLLVDNLVSYCASGARTTAPASKFIAGESRVAGKGEARGFIGFPGAAAGSENIAVMAVIAEATGGQHFSYEGAGLLAVPTGADVKSVISNCLAMSDAHIETAIEKASCNHAMANATISGVVSQVLDGSSDTDFSTVTVAAVRAKCQELAKGPKSLTVEGNLSGVPFAVEL